MAEIHIFSFYCWKCLKFDSNIKNRFTNKTWFFITELVLSYRYKIVHLVPVASWHENFICELWSFTRQLIWLNLFSVHRNWHFVATSMEDLIRFISNIIISSLCIIFSVFRRCEIFTKYDSAYCRIFLMIQQTNKNQKRFLENRLFIKFFGIWIVLWTIHWNSEPITFSHHFSEKFDNNLCDFRAHDDLDH